MYCGRDQIPSGDSCSDDSHVRSRNLPFFCWHNQKIHGMLARLRLSLYVSVRDQPFYKEAPRHPFVSTPVVIVYHRRILLRQNWLRTSLRQIFQVYGVISVLLALLQTARHRVLIDSKCTEWRPYNNNDLKFPQVDCASYQPPCSDSSASWVCKKSFGRPNIW